MKFIDQTGKKFNNLTVIRYAGRIGGYSHWECLCFCGKTSIVSIANLSTTKSCGCLKYRGKRYIDGRINTKAYKIWWGMVNRCTNPKHISWKIYGGRGIRVCDEWMKFPNFFKDMGERPPGKSIDRIDNDKGYFKENCRWATPAQQYNNRRQCIYIVHNGERLTISEWSKRTGLPHGKILKRFHSGWPTELIFLRSSLRFKKFKDYRLGRKSFSSP